jgi:hypothetical protein
MIYLLQIIIRNVQPIEQQTKDSFWGISYDGWFTGLTPILIFILGYIINKIIENNKERRRLKELEEYFIQSINLLQKPVNKQKQAFIDVSHKLKEKKEQHIILDYSPNFHVDQVREINNKDLYTIFIKNKKANISEKTALYGRLKAGIDYIDNLKISFKNDFLRFWESYDKNQQEYKRNIEITDEAFAEMVSQSRHPSMQNDLLLPALDQIRLKWMSYKKEGYEFYDMYIAKEMYINPVRELCKENMHDPRAVFIMKHIMLANYAFHNIEEAKKVYRRHFLLDARGLQQSWFDITNTLDKFSVM